MTSKKQKNIILIPARLNSSRLKNKLLLKIDGKSIIQHTYENSLGSKYSEKSIILVDSQKLFDHCQEFTQDVIKTSDKPKSGTERIIEYIQDENRYENIVNVQGDEPFVSIKTIDHLFKELNSGEKIVTAAFKITSDKYISNSNEVKVVIDNQNYALYFSRSNIPFNRNSIENYYRLIHLGVYGFKYDQLLKFNNFNYSYLENVEKLEQLKFLENSQKIKVLLSNEKTIGIDTKQDYENAKIFFDKLKKHN